jgi:DNA-cytosine methyltransferase
LFSGIGGFDLAAEWVGWENVLQVEKDPYCTAVLNKNFPYAQRFGDIKKTDFRPFRGLVDILSGGFPCQPFSDAGKRKGTDDDRVLWPEFERAICGIMPPWVVAENVNGLRKIALDLVCSSLEGKGYAVRPVIIPASAVGAWQRRERIWIIAHDNGPRIKDRGKDAQWRYINQGDKPSAENPTFADIVGGGCALQGLLGKQERRPDASRNYWLTHWVEIVTQFCRDPPRLPGRVDRIRALGNSISPQVAQRIFKLINEIES